MRPFNLLAVGLTALIVLLGAAGLQADCSCRVTGICNCVNCDCPAALAPQFVSQVLSQAYSQKEAEAVRQRQNQQGGVGHHTPQHVQPDPYAYSDGHTVDPALFPKNQQAPQQTPQKSAKQIPPGAVYCAECPAGYAYVNSNRGACASCGNGSYGYSGNGGNGGVLSKLRPRNWVGKLRPRNWFGGRRGGC